MANRSKSIGYIGEKRVAEYLGLQRTGALGTQIYDLHGDAFNRLLFVEVKSGKQVPKLVSSAFSQVLPHIADDSHQLPVVVMVPKGVGEKTLGDDAMAILRLKDLKMLLDGGRYGIQPPTKITIEMPTGERFVYDAGIAME